MEVFYVCFFKLLELYKLVFWFFFDLRNYLTSKACQAELAMECEEG